MPDGFTMSDVSKDQTAFLQVGVIAGSHGVRGLVRVKSFTEDPYDLTAYGDLTDKSGSRVFDLEFRGESKGQFLAKLDGVDDRNQADSLKGVGLFIERGSLPDLDDEEDGFYHADLINLKVVAESGPKDGPVFGFVKAVHDFGAGAILEIRTAEGDRLFPFTEATFPTVDLEAGVVTVNPPTEIEAKEEKP